MGATLEKIFYEKLTEMPADVRGIILIFQFDKILFRKLKSYLMHQNHLQERMLAMEILPFLFFHHQHQVNILIPHVCISESMIYFI